MNAVEVKGNLELKEKIRNSEAMDEEVVNALEEIMKSGPRKIHQGLKEWNAEDGLILYRGRIYVPNELELRREVVKSCHDPPIMGHPGRYKTLEIVQRNYWWPGMSTFVKNYVEGCVTCQESKNITHPTKEPIHPTEIPAMPFEIITTDFITDFPVCQGKDAILVVTDRHTKAFEAIPCNKTITADQTADLLVKHIFLRYGVPKKMISDRGPQYASKVMKEVLNSMGVRSALSTAYHPQTDGASERINQELEQYLRAYCTKMHDAWVDYLPYAVAAHNNRVHSATKETPFYLLHRYKPTWPHEIKITQDVPTATQCLNLIVRAREEAEASMRIQAELMTIANNKFSKEGPNWKPGDWVWLDGKNLNLLYASNKLKPRRFGPFTITDRIRQGSYKIKLPPTWKIHPVFHASLLTQAKETIEHGPNFERPPPDMVEGSPEYEVEEIRALKKDRGIWKYLVKWLGYEEAENTWEPLRHLTNAMDKVALYHVRYPDKPKPHMVPAPLPREMGTSPTKNICLAHVQRVKNNSSAYSSRDKTVRVIDRLIQEIMNNKFKQFRNHI